LDFYPILRWLPEFLTPMKRRAKELHKKEMDMYLSLWLEAKESISNGTSKDCICVSLAKQQEQNGFTDEQASYIAGSFLEAGSDTTSSTLYGFIQALLLFPEVQRKGQEELDRVIGPDRLPTLDDEDNLPYIRGCVKESLRWMPTALLGGVPHASTREDEYMGYRIPAGAGLVNNVYTIHMDPQRYPDPRKFKPERYKGDMQTAADSALNPDPSKRDHYVFGSGRRICLGIHVAERSLFIAISRMLWGFTFLPELDISGNPILPDPDKLTEGLSVLPEKFGVRIQPRDEARARKILEESKEMGEQ
jgi:cytochrome P450